MNKKTLIASLAFLLILASNASADAGGPVLLFINFPTFTIGQVWIVFSEYMYLKALLNSASKHKVLKTVIVMNLLSAALGAILFPALLAGLGLLGVLIGYKFNLASLSEYSFAIGTWLGGPMVQHVTLALVSGGIGFIVTYFLTVYIEYKYLQRKRIKDELPQISIRECFVFNAISYAGIIAFFVGAIFLFD